jgi:putative transposase
MGEIKELKMESSMTDENHCYQNAIAERVNGILKDEFNLDACFSNMFTAQQAVQRSIWVYNNKRRHFSLDLMTPEQFAMIA